MRKVQSGSMTKPPLGTEAKRFIVVVGLRGWEFRREVSYGLDTVVKLRSGSTVGLREALVHAGGGGK